MNVPSQPSFVIGIGASAGGLDSLERFFRNLPPDAGVTFVIVQHLSPDHKSLMHELLGRFTRIPVSEARGGEELKAGHIYLLPPGKELEVRPDRLEVFERTADRALSFPIDRMFTSLAESFGARAVAVVLSGSGSDGSRGARRIDAHGGLVMVEDPSLAAFDGMPRAAIDSGSAAAVMSAESLAHALIEHVQTGVVPQGDEMGQLEEVIEILKRKTGAEFEDYKRATIYRRAMRRAQLADQPSLRAYLDLLQSDAREVENLRHDLLVGVTSFFRNPEAFELMSQEIAKAVRSPIEPTRELRAWCAGCATGEEAYSIAMLFDEAIRAAGVDRTFKVFATDVNPRALDIAGAGIYEAARMGAVSEQRRSQYFLQRADGQFVVQGDLRHRIVFAKHDLLKDTPFTNLDLVTCRNMLIYLKLAAQRRSLASLSYGLRVGGLLFLGSSETPGDVGSAFDTVNETAKLYRKRVHTRGMHRPEIPTRVARLGGFTEPARPETRLLPIYDSLLERFMPPSFLLSEQRTLLDSYGDIARMLQIPHRRPTGDFFEMLPPGARTPLSALFSRAQREREPCSANVVLSPDGDNPERYVATAQRLDVRNSEPIYLLSLSREQTSPAGPAAERLEQSDHTADLEQELSHTRMTLQATVEELEASNEELQATNEELVASNEELQSVNEELHSVNEELHTVNSEHQHKIAQLSELNRDISHLLESTDVATVYLDRQLRIRKFTPRAAGIFGLVEHDIGRYLASFNHQLHYPTLMDDVSSVSAGGARVETEVRGRDDRWYFVRLLPYKVGSTIEGVVVTSTDATVLAAAKERARQLSSIVESSADAIIGMDLQGNILSWNAAAMRIYGYHAEEVLGQSIMMLVPPANQSEMRRIIAQIGNGEDHINIATTRVAKSGATLEIAKTMSPVRDAQGVLIGLATIDRDIREQKDLERRLRESERRYQDLYDNAPDMYLSVDTRSGRVVEFNGTFLKNTGYSEEALQGLHLLDLFPQPAQDAARGALGSLREGQSVNDLLLTIRCADTRELEVTLSATPVYAPDGAVIGGRTTLRDVSARRQAEMKLAQLAEMREQFLAMVSHELRGPLHAISAAFQILDDPETEEEARRRSQGVLRRQTRQMIRMVDDLLDVSRITHGKLHLERAPLDLSAVARSALDAVAPAFRDKGVRLLNEGFDARLPMFGDAGRLEQVLSNLLGNALRHTPEGASVHVSCAVDGPQCRLVVRDEGRGISGEDTKTIFDMFTQARQGLARTEGGLGLGLTIAQRIVTAHGGTLSVESAGLGKGAAFTIELALDPRAIVKHPTEPTADGTLTIVVVEDQQDARELMIEILTRDGHLAWAAPDGETGLSLILEKRPDVALLDIGLPGKNGFQLAAEVRRDLGSSITLVALSGYGQPEDVRQAEAAGFDDHLTKPLDHRKLRSLLRSATRRSPR